MTSYIEGKRAAIEALKSGAPLRRVLLAQNIERDDLVGDIIRKAKQRNVEVQEVPRKKLDAISERGSHQGVVCETAPFPYVGLSEIISAAENYADENGGRALIVMCDHITDAGNLGAIARSAESVGASGIVIPNKRSAQVTAATYKSSAGAISHIPIAQVANIATTLERLKDVGFWVIAATEHADDLLWKTNMKGLIAIVLGSEQNGISRLVLEKSDMLAKLPQIGEISSLNVAQAATVFMYEWLRQNF